MASPPNKQPTGKPMTRKCGSCYISKSEKELFACSKCKAARYCSKECQRADWKAHKYVCQTNGLLASVLKAHAASPAGMLDRLLLVDGISRLELDQRLEKWVRFHTPMLMIAALTALELRADIGRARTHVLHLMLDARPRAEHGDNPGRYFRVKDAVVVEVAEAMTRPSPWPEQLMQLARWADNGERLGEGTTTAVMVECPPLWVQTVPLSSLTASSVRKDGIQGGEWKAFLVEHIEQGVRPKMVKGHRAGV